MRYIATKKLILKESVVNGYERLEEGGVIIWACDCDTGNEIKAITEPYDEDELRKILENSNLDTSDYRYLVKDSKGYIKTCTAKNINFEILSEEERGSMSAPKILFYNIGEDKQ